MNWYPKDCVCGDIIRINLGSIYHYGIFIDENNVIQFGLPPIPKYILPAEKIVVCSSDIETFSCGKIVEVCVYSKAENKKRFSNADIAKRATESLGTGGYNLLHNNCEHFVNYCAFGKAFCSVEDEALKRWRSRPIFDIYLMPYRSNKVKNDFSCRKRTAQIDKVSDADRKYAKKAAWTLLEKAIEHSFKLGADEVEFKKTVFGKWTSDSVCFSIAHSQDCVAVAVSNENCGIDIEAFSEENKSSAVLQTEKKCLYKLSGRRFTVPKAQIGTVMQKDLGLIISYCGKHIKNAKFYLLNNDVPSLTDGGEVLL